jgi:hypothetical protein
MLTALVIVKLVAEIALMALLGRWVLGLLAGQKREQNLFYQILDIMARPFVWSARRIAPRMILDRHVPLVAFCLVGFTWLAATLWRIQICIEMGVHLCH